MHDGIHSGFLSWSRRKKRTNWISTAKLISERFIPVPTKRCQMGSSVLPLIWIKNRGNLHNRINKSTQTIRKHLGKPQECSHLHSLFISFWHGTSTWRTGSSAFGALLLRAPSSKFDSQWPSLLAPPFWCVSHRVGVCDTCAKRNAKQLIDFALLEVDKKEKRDYTYCHYFFFSFASPNPSVFGQLKKEKKKDHKQRDERESNIYIYNTAVANLVMIHFKGTLSLSLFLSLCVCVVRQSPIMCWHFLCLTKRCVYTSWACIDFCRAALLCYIAVRHREQEQPFLRDWIGGNDQHQGGGEG